VTFQDASGMIARVDRLQHLTQAFREHSPTARGQLAGIALMIVPGLAQAVPFDGALAGMVRILAVLVGFVGVLIVFGGMLQYAYLQLAAPILDDGPTTPTTPATTGTATTPTTGTATATAGTTAATAATGMATAGTATTTMGTTPGSSATAGTTTGTTTASLDEVLLAVPYARTVWACLALLGLALGIGALWCLVLVFSRGWDEYLAAALMFALPAATLAWLAWRARAMRT
jgi:hypothetical protein